MTSGKPDKTTYRAELVAESQRAKQIAGVLAELLWPPADAVGVFDVGNGDWRVEAYFDDQPNKKELQALLAGQFGEEFAAGLTVKAITPADWVSESQAMRPPVAAGRFLIHGRHDRARIGRRAKAIEIDAAQAFGTGHHGSTLGSLLALDRLLKRRNFRNIMDLGTGTGVLAIAAAKHGHRSVLATDSVLQTVEIARENIDLNELSSLILVVYCTGFEHPKVHRRGPFDLVLANILLWALAGLAPDMASHIVPGGHVVLAGITRPQAAELTARYRGFGFDLVEKLDVGEWTTLTMRRRRH